MIDFIKHRSILLLITVVLFIATISFISHKSNEEEKYYGIVTTILGTYEGEFAIKLNGENKGMISIKTIDINSKKKGKKISYKETVSINAMAIKKVEIDGIVYTIRNIAKDDNGYFENCCLRVTDTSSVVTLAYWGTSTNTDKCFAKTKYDNYYQPLKSILYFNFCMLFNNCPSLATKINQEHKDYITTFEKLSQEELLTKWRAFIKEYNQCFEK